MADRAARRMFWSAALTGVAGAALAAVGSSRVWVIASATVADVGGSGSATAEAEEARPLRLRWHWVWWPWPHGARSWSPAGSRVG